MDLIGLARRMKADLARTDTARFNDAAFMQAITRLRMNHHTTLLTAFASAALVLGLLVYATERDLSHSAWIPNALAIPGRVLFGVCGGWLPSCAHAFAFSLLTAASAPPRRAPVYGACLLWASIDVAMELGQHPALRDGLDRTIRAVFGNSLLPTVTGRYFTHGTFDPADVAAALAGAAGAAIFLCIVQPPPRNQHD